MDQIIGPRLEKGIEIVIRHFSRDEQPAVRAFLLRAVMGLKWEAIAHRLGLADRAVWVLARRGEVLLDRAIERGRLERIAMERELAACIPNRRQMIAP